jgi:hypothetical protein
VEIRDTLKQGDGGATSKYHETSGCQIAYKP